MTILGMLRGGHVTEGHDGAAGNRSNFLRTDELAAGMEISTQDGDGLSVIELIKTTDRAPTYNLTVTNSHILMPTHFSLAMTAYGCIMG